MNKIILTTFLLIIIVRGYSQYVFKDRERKDSFTDLPQGPTPKWSPNGRSYAMITNTKNKSKIAIITGDSFEFIIGAQNNFEWSHDGQSIVYTEKDENQLLKVFKYCLKTKEKVKISHNSSNSDFYPSISLGDSIITYYNYGMGSKSQLYYTNTNKGTSEKLIDDPLVEYFHPKWSPSGNLFLYWKSQKSKTTIEINEMRTGRKLLTISGDDFDFMDWSKDEQEILCDFNSKLLKIRLADGAKTEISSAFKKIIGAKWSPKGDFITFDADGDIYVVNSNGQGQRKICSKGIDPSWHPSGQRIIFVKDSKGYPIYETDTQGENLKLLYDGKKRKKGG